jgi:hypothetical protein
MKRLGLTVLIVALLGSFGYWWNSPAQVLKRQTLKILHTLTLESGTGRASRQTGVYVLKALLAPTVDLDSPDFPEASGSFERTEAESTFSWLCDQAKQTRFTLENFRSVTIQRDQAEVVFSIEALVELPSGRPVDGHYEVTFHWQMESDAWHLTRANWAAG